MWKPRLIALDLDGTLIPPDDVLPASVAQAVRGAAAAGATIVLATGRAWHATRWVADELGLAPGMHVCSNGAVVVSHPPQEIVQEVTFDARLVVERVLAEHPHCLLGVQIGGAGYVVNKEFPRGELSGDVRVVPLDELWAQPATRVIVRDPDATDGEFIGLAHRLGLEGVSYSIGYTAWLDIGPEGVNKATALAAVASRVGVDAEDVLAIGDGRNDIEMLRWAGRGVTFPDSPPEVIAAADIVADAPFLDGGTVRELQRWA